MESNASRDAKTQLASALYISFDNFHTGGTPNTASEARKFFPPEGAEVLNTPTGDDVTAIAKTNRVFFPDDPSKKSLPTLHADGALQVCKLSKLDSSKDRSKSFFIYLNAFKV